MGPFDIDQIVLTHHHRTMGLFDYFPMSRLGTDADKWIGLSGCMTSELKEFYLDMYKISGVPENYFSTIKQLEWQLKYSCNGKN